MCNIDVHMKEMTLLWIVEKSKKGLKIVKQLLSSCFFKILKLERCDHKKKLTVNWSI